VIRRALFLFTFAATAAAAQRSDADVERLSRAGTARTVGNDSARVLVLEFLDFECPICAAFHVQRGDSLRAALGSDVRMVYVNFPLTQHMYSLHGAEAATCAGAIGGKTAFTKMADALYRQQKEWVQSDDPTPFFVRYAQQAGVDAAAFADCRVRDVMAPLILSDLETAGKFGIGGTPTFVVLAQGAKSANDAFSVAGNVPVSQIVDLINKARASIK
jgi:protein-disulfide isomerase